MATTTSYAHLFCPQCGDLLALKEAQRKATCGSCTYQCAIEASMGVTLVSKSEPKEWMRRYGVQPIVRESSILDKEVEHNRAIVEEDCPQCGHRGLEFYTLQLRSADEGQTVFYECPKCKHKFSQNT